MVVSIFQSLYHWKLLIDSNLLKLITVNSRSYHMFCLDERGTLFRIQLLKVSIKALMNALSIVYGT